MDLQGPPVRVRLRLQRDLVKPHANLASPLRSPIPIHSVELPNANSPASFLSILSGGAVGNSARGLRLGSSVSDLLLHYQWLLAILMPWTLCWDFSTALYLVRWPDMDLTAPEHFARISTL